MSTSKTHIFSCYYRRNIRYPLFEKTPWWKFWNIPVRFVGMGVRSQWVQHVQELSAEEAKEILKLNIEELREWISKKIEEQEEHQFDRIHGATLETQPVETPYIETKSSDP